MEDETDKSVARMKDVLTAMLDKLQSKIDSTEKVESSTIYSYLSQLYVQNTNISSHVKYPHFNKVLTKTV